MKKTAKRKAAKKPKAKKKPSKAKDGYISTQTQRDRNKRRRGARGLHELYNLGT
jgi:hypothetical protein